MKANMKTTADLYRVVEDGRYQYVAGMLGAICAYEGTRKAAAVARFLGVPIEVALYAVRNAKWP